MTKLWNISFITLNSTLLALYYPTSTSPPPSLTLSEALALEPKPRICDRQIPVYLIGQTLLYGLYSLPQKPLQYLVENVRPDLKRHPIVMGLWGFWSFVTLFDIGWFVAAQIWVFNSKYCKEGNPPLYWLAVSEIIFFYVTTIIPLVFYIFLVYIAYRRRRLQGPTAGAGAGLTGGLTKRELDSLRTFLFRPSLGEGGTGKEVQGEGEDVEMGGLEKKVEDGTGKGTKEAGEVDDGKDEEIDAVPVIHIQEEERKEEGQDDAPIVLVIPPSSSSSSATNISPPTAVDITSPEPSTLLSPTSIQPPPKDSTDVPSPSSTPPPSPQKPTPTSPTSPSKQQKEPPQEEEAPLPPNAPTNCTICITDFVPGDRIRDGSLYPKNPVKDPSAAAAEATEPVRCVSRKP
ncbi:hypothetical protein HDV05_006260 [Chytridiales sp. JEL 0842]|nr:hypothetical protein HDV05_006260 [Chytridiales sp. JEL 0842]